MSHDGCNLTCIGAANCSVRETYAVLLELKQEIGKIQGDVQAILRQTQLTNGRVTALEQETDRLKQKWATAAGAGGIISGLIVGAWQWITKG